MTTKESASALKDSKRKSAQMPPKASEAAKLLATCRRTNEMFTRERLLAVKPAAYNKARTITDAQLQLLCVAIVEFGIVDPFIVRGEDDLMIGGHQRQKAVKKLLEGPFKYTAIDGEQRTVTWEFPKEGAPVVLLHGLDERQTKILNLGLNQQGGDWEHDALAKLIGELAKDSPNLAALAGGTGFSVAELTDYVDIAKEMDVGALLGTGGDMPVLTQKAPSLSLDFTTKELRDAVKSAVAAKAKANEPSGDALARLLDVKAPRKALRK